MSLGRRRGMVDREHPNLPIVRQCALLGVSRSSLYYRPKATSEEDLSLMREMDRQYLETPFYGSRRMKAWLERRGIAVSRKRVQRLMRAMGMRAIYRRPSTSRKAPEHRVYPYLLRNAMDGKGRYSDNIFLERLWRTVKYEEVYLKAYASVLEAQRGLEDYFRFYNDLRPHQALGYRTPAEVFHGGQEVEEEESSGRRCSPGIGAELLAGAQGLSLNSALILSN